MKTIFSLAISNLKKNKSKSFLVLITIILTTALLTSVGLTCANWIEANTEITRQRVGAYDGLYLGVSPEQITNIKNNEDAAEVAIRTTLGRIRNEEDFLGIMYVDENTPEKINMNITEGEFPSKYNEIAIQDGYITNILGKDLKVGDSIELEYEVVKTSEIRKDKFLISGIIKTEEAHNETKSYTAVISEEYLDALAIKNLTYSVCVTVKNDKNLSSDEIIDLVNEIAIDSGVSIYDVEINDDYINATNPDMTVIGGGIVLALIIVFSSVIVIYSIFYVSIINKVQEFGKIKAIGATEKQVRGLVLLEGLILSTISIPIGLLLGNLISNTIIINIMGFKQFNVGKFNFGINILVVLISYLTVFISLLKPMKIAEKISPVEAMRYTGEVSNGNIKRKGYAEMDIKKLTLANIMRFKKRTCITLVSLSLSGILFMTISTVLNSIDAEKMSRLQMPCEFSLMLDKYTVGNGESTDNDLEVVQSYNPLGKEFQDTLKGFTGINEVKSYSAVRASWYLDNNEKIDTIIGGFAESDLEKIEKSLIVGEINYENLLSGKSAIISNPTFAEDYGIDVGDKVKLNIYDSNEIFEKEFVIEAICNKDELGDGIVIPNETVENLVSQDTEIILDIYIDDKYYSEVEEFLNKINDNEKFIKLSSLEDTIKVNKRSIAVTQTLGYSLVIIIGVIGFMNLVNTMITSIIARKRELSILQAIGLTNKQLIQMLNLEGIFYVAGTLIMSLTLGNIVGYIAFIIFKNTGASYAIYSYPLSQTLIMIFILVIAQGLISYLLCKNFNKDSLVDRIRYSE